jgi:hypothetical protein
VSQTVTYKGHQIRAVAIPVQESEEGAWAAHAVIRVPLPTGQSREQRLPDPDDRTFPTQEDAEGYAVQLGMRWVDRHGL